MTRSTSAVLAGSRSFSDLDGDGGTIPPGDWAAWTDKPLAPFQDKFLSDCVPGRKRIVGLTMGRGGGKTFLAGMVAAEELVVYGGTIFLVASSFQQAHLAFEDTLAALRYRFPPSRFAARFRVNDYSNKALIEDRRTGGILRAVGADAERAHGWRPSLIIADEGASWKVGGERLWNAARTSLGKVPGSRIIALGTRPAWSGHWFSKVLDLRGDNYDPDVRIHYYAANPEADPFSWRQIHRANPGLRYGFPDRGQLSLERRLALTDPSARMSWRALRLNLGEPEGGTGTVLIPPEVWAEARSLPVPDPEGDFVIGLDIGGKRSLSSVAAYWPGTGRLDSLSSCGGIPSLPERGLEDNVGSLYSVAADGGELLVDYDRRYPDTARLLDFAIREWGRPYLIIADQFRRAETEDLAAAYGLPLDFVHGGSKQGVEIIGRVKKAFGDKLVRPVPRVLLDYAVSKARSKITFAGDEVLDLRGKPGHMKDDPAAAAFLAVAVGRKLADEVAPSARIWAL